MLHRQHNRISNTDIVLYKQKQDTAFEQDYACKRLICFLVKKLYNIRDTLFPDSDPLLELPQAMLSLNIPSSASTTTTTTTATTTIFPTTTLATTTTTRPPPPRLTTARQSTRTLAAGASPREEIRKVSHQKVGRPEGQRV